MPQCVINMNKDQSKWNPENKKLTFFSLLGELVRISQYLHPHVVRKQQTLQPAICCGFYNKGQAHVHVSASAKTLRSRSFRKSPTFKVLLLK